MQIEEMKVGFHKKVALKEVFPISSRYALRKCFALGCVLLPFFAICTYSALHWQLAPFERKVVAWSQLAALGLLAAVYLKAELYRLSFNYEMDGLRFVISRGVLLKKVGSLPLLPVTEVYIQRSFLDMICGLANVDIYTPMDATRQFARIEALAPRDAHNLQCFLGDFLTTQVFINPAASEGRRDDVLQQHEKQEEKKSETKVYELPLPDDDLPIDWKRAKKPIKNSQQGVLRLP